MDIDSTRNIIKKGALEVVTPDELDEKIRKNQKTAYIGYEPSGKVHLGHAITVKKMIDLEKAGFKVKILLADLHAFLNDKGSLEEIKEISDYNAKCLRALGLSEEAEFILGSSLQTRAVYKMKVGIGVSHSLFLMSSIKCSTGSVG